MAACSHAHPDYVENWYKSKTTKSTGLLPINQSTNQPTCEISHPNIHYHHTSLDMFVLPHCDIMMIKLFATTIKAEMRMSEDANQFGTHIHFPAPRTYWWILWTKRYWPRLNGKSRMTYTFEQSTSWKPNSWRCWFRWAMKKMPWLVVWYRGWSSLPSYMGIIFINHEIRIPIKQAVYTKVKVHGTGPVCWFI